MTIRIKKLLLILTICDIVNIQAHASVCTDYLANDLTQSYGKQITIVSKDENIDKLETYMGSQFISSLIYGKGKMKLKNKPLSKIHYSCFVENDSKFIFGYIYKD